MLVTYHYSFHKHHYGKLSTIPDMHGKFLTRVILYLGEKNMLIVDAVG
jgi:hypothetical protein